MIAPKNPDIESCCMLRFSNLALRRSTSLLFEAVDFKIYPGQKLGITGANGCGKSSLFALIRGELTADQGQFGLPRHWAVATVEQETRLSDRVALEYVIDGDEELREVESRLGDSFSLRAYHDEVLSYGSPSGKYVRALVLDEPIPL